MSVVIPALNEEKNIGWVLERMPGCVDEVIVVNGRSTDDTEGAARRARPDALMLHELQPGKGAALRAGFAAASGDYVVMLDADGSMEPAEIDRYVAELEAGADLVKGSRFMREGSTEDISPLRSVGNRALLGVANTLYGAEFTELCYGYMGLRRNAIGRLDLDADGFEIEAQIVAHGMRAGLNVTEVPSTEAPRRSGESNLRTFRDGSRVLRELLRARVRKLPPDDGHAIATQPRHADAV